jgi:hypothetical protein
MAEMAEIVADIAKIVADIDDDALLVRIKDAVSCVKVLEENAKSMQESAASWTRELGALLVVAKRRHPTTKEFGAYLKKAGLGLSRAYEIMSIVEGRSTEEGVREATRTRVRKHRAAKKPFSVTGDVTESAEETAALDVSARQEFTDWLDATDREAKISSEALAEFTLAARKYLPKMTETDQQKACDLVKRLTPISGWRSNKRLTPVAEAAADPEMPVTKH